MSGKSVGAAQFKPIACLIDETSRSPETITITKHGRPVAVLSPAPLEARSIIGSLKGSVLRFDDPIAPATAPSDWTANG